MAIDTGALTNSALGVIVLLSFYGNYAQWRENARLNKELLKTTREVTKTDAKLLDGLTVALTNFNKKVDESRKEPK